MYSEQLEKLIEIALSDGEFTDKKKQVLFKRAEKEGVDLDEFEMVLESRLSQQNRIQSPNVTTQQPISDKQGEIKKCPACGAIAESFATRCSDCGTEFRGVTASNSIQKLFEMLDEAESQRDDKVTTGGIIGGLFQNSIGGGAISEAFGVTSKTDKRKKEIISSFPIPNTKEDILEFLSLAYPKAKQKGNFLTKNNPENITHNGFAPVWKAKCEQIIIKARFSMKNDKEILNEINQYASELGIK